MAHELPGGTRLRFQPGHYVDLRAVLHASFTMEWFDLIDVNARLAQHARFDVGHELVLPERARSDHR